MSGEAGRPWAAKLLPLPPFLLPGAGGRADFAALEDAFRLTGFFFSRNVYEPRAMGEPEARASFLGAVRRHRGGENAA